ncbi:MAG: GNVR domain-containing protein, partial [Candidatus Omnitrophica bacterium]|nr:GNVR domain-containing protein [Candidatus Omnitrophota bacterium]
MIPAPELRELTIKDYWAIIIRHIWVILTFLIVIPLGVGLYSFNSVKVYRTQVKMLIRADNPSNRGQRNQEYMMYREGISIDEYISILRSPKVAGAVIKTLKLAGDREFLGVDDPAKKILNMISVKTEEGSNIVFLSVEGADPLKITNIANTWADEFIKEDISKKSGSATKGASLIKEQLDESLRRLQEAEKEMNAFIRKNRIVTIPEAGEEKERLLDILKQEKAQIETKILDASGRYGDKHPIIISLQSQLEATDIKLKQETDDLFSLQEKSLDYRILKRKLETERTLYESFLNRIKDLEMSREMVISNVQVIDDAELPIRPIKPNPVQDITKAIILGLFLGVGLSFFLEYL